MPTAGTAIERARTAAGGDQKLEAWYLAAYRVAIGSVPAQDVDDVAQEVMLELVKSERRHGAAGPGLAYVVAKRVVYHYYARHHHREEALEEAETLSTEDPGRIEDLIAAGEVLASIRPRTAAILMRYAQGESLDAKERKVLQRLRERVRLLTA